MADITKTNLYANSTTQKRTEDKDSGEADRRKAGLTKGK
jgi:hypothetical protein